MAHYTFGVTKMNENAFTILRNHENPAKKFLDEIQLVKYPKIYYAIDANII